MAQILKLKLNTICCIEFLTCFLLDSNYFQIFYQSCIFQDWGLKGNFMQSRLSSGPLFLYFNLYFI